MHHNFAGAEAEVGQEALIRAAQAIREVHRDLLTDENILDVSVSFDGTWQKRGFTSLYGVGVCIEVMTGLIIDFHVLSKYCHACELHKGLPEDELQQWKVTHTEDCCINHQLSSKAMEQEAAKVMWGRSLEKHQMRYRHMLSDGDSAAYKAVCDLAPYGDVQVEKLECLNHAHKRMGTALRKLTKTEHLGGRGTGRLTEKKCDDLQNYYRGAILQNLNDVDKMRSSIWAGLFHSMSTDEKPLHQRCPAGEDSWCGYQKALARNEAPPSHATCHTYVAHDVAERMVGVYKRMSDQALLARLVHGGTQNANEAFNSQIWLRCPKTVFFGKRRVDGAVARAVGLFNEGATDLTRVMNKMWVDISSNTLKSLNEQDRRRLKAAAKAFSDDAKKRRKTGDVAKRRENRENEAAEGPTYGAGMAD